MTSTETPTTDVSVNLTPFMSYQMQSTSTMEGKRNVESHTKPLSERDKHILSIYGTVPSGGILGQHAKRVYFDSGDYALSAAKRETDSGAIHTGTSHPVRGSISHPYAPIPNTSNVVTGADGGFHGKDYPSTGLVSSPLSQESDTTAEDYFGDQSEVTD
ncbi:hypothetical protein ASPCAL07937 [Aspergillus calidoustus]|uniref:mRNA stability protein n=1 Tax=Aspergillus calidoustus TaxID=454130 RepID=A0A0U5GT62_ASPCI|nr:hypothetical protein ASPCAL07937 [Aspergillus calidoustus]